MCIIVGVRGKKWSRFLGQKKQSGLVGVYSHTEVRASPPGTVAYICS